MDRFLSLSLYVCVWVRERLPECRKSARYAFGQQRAQW